MGRARKPLEIISKPTECSKMQFSDCGLNWNTSKRAPFNHQPKAVLWNAHLGLQPKYKVSNQITNTKNISNLGRKAPRFFFTQPLLGKWPDPTRHLPGMVHGFCASRFPANIDQGSCFAERCALLEGSRPETQWLRSLGWLMSWFQERKHRETPERVNTACSHRKSYIVMNSMKNPIQFL